MSSECLLRIPRAEKESLDEGADNAVKTQIDEEGRLEAIEASMRAKRGSAKKTNERVSEMSMSSNSGGMAEWKEGSLFPEGWDDMNPLQKITELYMGKRGFLFWSTKLSLAGVITLAVAWIAFRFIGPALGLYTLTNDLSTPSF